IALGVGDRDHCIVKGRIDVCDAGRDVLALAAFNAGSFFCHYPIPSNAPVMPGARDPSILGASAWPIPYAASAVRNFLLNLLLLAGDGLGLALAGPGVGVGALAAHRQLPPVAETAVAAKVHQALDVDRDLAA